MNHWPVQNVGCADSDLSSASIKLSGSVLEQQGPDKLYQLTAAGRAQSVERLTAEWEVSGSIPGVGLILRVLKIIEK